MLVLSSASPFPGTELWERVHQDRLPAPRGGVGRWGKNRLLPGSIDFRIPQVNLTSLPDDEYQRIFADIKDSFTAWNQGALQRKGYA